MKHVHVLGLIIGYVRHTTRMHTSFAFLVCLLLQIKTNERGLTFANCIEISNCTEQRSKNSSIELSFPLSMEQKQPFPK